MLRLLALYHGALHCFYFLQLVFHILSKALFLRQGRKVLALRLCCTFNGLLTVGAVLLQAHHLVQFVVVNEQNFFGGQSKVILGHAAILKARKHRVLAASNRILKVQLVVLIE